jgi:anaerobic magnesium-protoporphyrin IX monomethyl ester cyclase
MRITLVHPAGFNFVPGQPDFSVLANRMPPIGIRQRARVVAGRAAARGLPRDRLPLCMGEGEGAMLDLAEGKALRGSTTWSGATAAASSATRAASASTTSTSCPSPPTRSWRATRSSYHLPLFSYVKRWGATMITSRGCPFTCSFCDRTVFERKYRFNSADYILRHMQHLRDRFGVRHVNFYDDLFTANRQAHPRAVRAADRTSRWACTSTAPSAPARRRRDVPQAQAAGALMVSMGIESADPGMMERHKAGVTLDEVRTRCA